MLGRRCLMLLRPIAEMDGNVFRLNPLNGIFRYELKRPFDKMLGSAVNHIGSGLSLMKNPV